MQWDGTMNIRGFPRVFQKSIKGNVPKKKRNKYRNILICILIIILIMLGCDYVEHHVMPIVIDIASLKINTMATKIINEAVEETLVEEAVTTEDFLSYTYNQEGTIESCRVNTVLINKITSKIIAKITEDVDGSQHEELMIPFGHLIGEGVFSNYGPDIAVEIMPLGTANINYDKEFVSTGINQINYRIWLDIDLTMQLILPLNRERVVVKQEVTLVDSIFSGDIPDNYVNVPDDNILDVVE
jgi:sporulation protein YunB